MPARQSSTGGDEVRTPGGHPGRSNDHRNTGNTKRRNAVERKTWAWHAPVPGFPARDDGSILTAGLLAYGYVSPICLPAPFRHSGMTPFGVTRMDGNPLTVAGAATVLVPVWVLRTVFPINPLALGLGNRRPSDKGRHDPASSRKVDRFTIALRRQTEDRSCWLHRLPWLNM